MDILYSLEGMLIEDHDAVEYKIKNTGLRIAPWDFFGQEMFEPLLISDKKSDGFTRAAFSNIACAMNALIGLVTDEVCRLIDRKSMTKLDLEQLGIPGSIACVQGCNGYRIVNASGHECVTADIRVAVAQLLYHAAMEWAGPAKKPDDAALDDTSKTAAMSLSAAAAYTAAVHDEAK